jgi:hypothetical protein
MRYIFLLLCSVASAHADTFERATDRPGSDYTQIIVSSPEKCQAACRNNVKCKAWTFVRKDFQGPAPRCYFKSSIPKKDEGECCTSGVMSR